MLRHLRLVAAAALALMAAPSLEAGGEADRVDYRPAYHFTPPKNWMNDPNGLVYFDGEYHLFYQYNPEGIRWGHMSWGHAVSRDLVRWEHLPVALREEGNVMIFSGSAVIDHSNTSGFGVDGRPPMVAIYTAHHTDRPLQNQHIAYSNDRGRTWTKYEGNPVLDVGMADFRDPKVFWHEPSSRWVMTVALSTEQRVHLYSSPDLKEWEFTGEFGPAGATDGLWECPDLFPLPDDQGGRKWVLIVNINPGGPAGGSGCQYFVGDFDGRTFTAQGQPTAAVPRGELLAGFEDGYGRWRAEGEAFGGEPASGALPRQQAVAGYIGRRLVNSYHGGDGPQGTLTSPTFTIDQPYLNFLIGGGSHPDVRVDLRVGGEILRSATGRGDEKLLWHSWDVGELQGKQAEIQIIDRRSGGWGHINADHFMLSDAAAYPSAEVANWADYGPDFYAAVSWNDAPTSDGRRPWIGWMSNWSYAGQTPTEPWRSAMSIPRELTLARVADEYILRQRPVSELRGLRRDTKRFEGGEVDAANAWLSREKVGGQQLELEAVFDSPDGATEGLRLLVGDGCYTTIGIDREARGVYVDRTESGNVQFDPAFAGVYTAPIRDAAGPIKLNVLVDECSVEVFVNDGEQVLTTLVFPPAGAGGVEVFGTDETEIESLTVYELEPSQRVIDR